MILSICFLSYLPETLHLTSNIKGLSSPFQIYLDATHVTDTSEPHLAIEHFWWLLGMHFMSYCCIHLCYEYVSLSLHLCDK